MVFDEITVTWEEIQDIDTIDIELYCGDCDEKLDFKFDTMQCWSCEGTNRRRKGRYFIKAIVPFDESA